MKKLLLSTMLVGLAVGVYAQGQINLSVNNTDASPTATSNGKFWLDAGSGPAPINTDFNVNFYGGSDANSLVLLKSLVNSGGGAALGAGTFLDLSGAPVSIPGALTSGFFRVDAWVNATTFDSAVTRASSPVFGNPLGNPNAQPPGVPTDFANMPALVMVIPEPSTFALAGLGAAALLIFRRRK
jgi:hypothetical protein